MKKFAGVWLDHSEAFIVLLEGDNHTIRHLKNGIPGQHRSTGGSRPGLAYGPQDKVNEHRFDEKRRHKIREFDQKILNQLRGVEHFFIFGPAEAKKEFKSYIETQPVMKDKLVGVESADSMTTNQIVAAVKEYYEKRKEFI